MKKPVPNDLISGYKLGKGYNLLFKKDLKADLR